MASALYMDAVITPNRSLTPRGFIVLISIMTVMNCATAAVFLIKGATWVPIFLAIDLLAVVAAFLASFRAQRFVERVQVTPQEICVTHETPRFRREVWRSATAFTRIALEREDERVVALKLRLSGREVAVAAVLSSKERAEFARALERAMGEACRHRG